MPDRPRGLLEPCAATSGPHGSEGAPAQQCAGATRHQHPPRAVAWLDARHRSHVHVEDDVKQAKAIGLNRWPSRHWKVNVAWITVVAMAASLLAAFRHLGLPDGDLRKASIKSLRFRLFEVPGRITYGQRKTWLHLPADWPWTPDLTASWQTIKTLPIPI